MDFDTRRAGYVLLLITLLALAGLWFLPKLIASFAFTNIAPGAAREGQARLLLAFLLSVTAVIALLVFSARIVLRAERAARMAEESLQETRLALSATQNKVVALELKLRLAEGKTLSDGKALTKDLSDRDPSVRIGAIYSLEQIAAESERFHWSVVEVLTAFVRRNTPRSKESVSRTAAEPADDLSAALSVIGRRPEGRDERGFVNLSGTNLAGVRWEGALLTHADLSGSSLVRARMNEARMGLANLSRADLTGADLTHANLNGASLQKAVLNDAQLQNADLNGAELTGASLQGANLAGADMNAAYLNGADLSRATLSRASLFGADLNGADMTGATLTRANLLMTDLTAANLTGADLTGADLRWAIGLTQAQLDSTITDTHTQVDAPLSVGATPGSLPPPLRQARLITQG